MSAVFALVPAGMTTIERSAPVVPTATKTSSTLNQVRYNEIPTMHDRSKPLAPLSQLSRNLFAFRTAGIAHSIAVVRVAPTPAETPNTAAPAPKLKLIGIAADSEAGGTVRTAIISDADQLFLVKKDDAVTLQYRVSSITDDAVELSDTATGLMLRLALK